ncbi:MAG TPA: ABC transporter ATP-binding protein [Candidatus Nanopelagicaceae bacterium]|nr:ABC transporter ATP-binding protein [Candidatus Nanopelagicaceae bacterium]
MAQQKKVTNNEALITFQNISKSYNNSLALDNISFTINKGDVFGYIGPNGAGKTTTIKILVGLIRDYIGKVYIEGKDISNSRQELYKILGYHPQEAGFQSWRTVEHALRTFGRLSGLKQDHLELKITEVLKFVNLEEVRNKKIIHLSGGMLQKLRLAQALLNDPQILVLDEPLSGLDPSSRYQVKNLIKSLSLQGITIFFSSHILSDIQDISNKIGILNKGRVIKIGDPNELQNEFLIGNIIEVVYTEVGNPCQNLEQIDGVEKIELGAPNKQLIHLEANADLDNTIQKILRSIADQKCKMRNFQILKPSLEEVYLKYIEGDIK